MKNAIKILILTTGILLFLSFIIPYFTAGIFNLGSIAGIIFSSFLIIYGIKFHNINAFIARLWHSTGGKVLLSITGAFTAAIIVFILIITAGMIKTSYNTPKEETTVVVLGCQVKPWGPSLMLQERLKSAYNYLSENENISCILSGGQGADEPMSEAEAMYNWLVDKGIDKNRLYMEDKSTNTRENLLFSKELIEKEGLSPIITIVTHDFHQYRATLIAKSIGIEPYNVSGRTFAVFYPVFYVRELAGVLYELIK